MKRLCLLPVVLFTLVCALDISSLKGQEERVFQERFTNLAGELVSWGNYGWQGIHYDPDFADSSKPVDISIWGQQPHATAAAIRPDIE